jgi:hypothetical protein
VAEGLEQDGQQRGRVGGQAEQRTTEAVIQFLAIKTQVGKSLRGWPVHGLFIYEAVSAKLASDRTQKGAMPVEKLAPPEHLFPSYVLRSKSTWANQGKGTQVVALMGPASHRGILDSQIITKRRL